MIKLVFIDMSKTLVKGSGANAGADFLGKGDVYRELYPRYKSGDIPIEKLLTETFKCWAGLKVEELPKVFERLEYNEGVKETIKRLKEKGIKTALVSNVPKHLNEIIQKDLGLDFITGSILEIKNRVFTGKVLEFSHDKATEAIKILEEQKIPPDEAISIGDRKDDSKVFEKVKFGVAYNGDETAKKAAKYQITDFRELIDIIEKESQNSP